GQRRRLPGRQRRHAPGPSLPGPGDREHHPDLVWRPLMPRHNGNPFKAGMITLSTVAALLLLALGINLSFGLPFNLSLWPPGSDYTIKTAFSDANALTRGADVVESGHVVGQVMGVDGQGRQAIVTIRLANTYAQLRQ